MTSRANKFAGDVGGRGEVFTPLLAIELFIEPSIECTRPRSRAIVSPRSPGCLQKAQHRGRTLALAFVPSLTLVPVVACALPSIVSPDPHDSSHNKVKPPHQHQSVTLGDCTVDRLGNDWHPGARQSQGDAYVKQPEVPQRM